MSVQLIVVPEIHGMSRQTSKSDLDLEQAQKLPGPVDSRQVIMLRFSSKFFFIFLYIVWSLALSISETVVYSLGESNCTNSKPITVRIYLLISCIIGFVIFAISVFNHLLGFPEFQLPFLQLNRFFRFFWCILGIASLAFNESPDCTSSHSFQMTLASIIIYLFILVHISDQEKV